MKKYKVAFICVHNSCRSQMAEAISKLLASDTFEIYSAGTHIKNQINQDAVKVIKDRCPVLSIFLFSKYSYLLGGEGLLSLRVTARGRSIGLTDIFP